MDPTAFPSIPKSTTMISFYAGVLIAPSVRDHLRRLAEWLVEKGYEIETRRMGSEGQIELGRESRHPLRMAKSLGDGFRTELRVSARTDEVTGEITELKKMVIRIRYELVDKAWTLSPWTDVEAAQRFLLKIEGKTKPRVEKAKQYLCPRCLRTRQQEGLTDDARGHKGMLVQADGVWACKRCGLLWGDHEPPILQLRRGDARLQFETLCPHDSQPLVWAKGSQELRCSAYPKCGYLIDGAELMALKLSADEPASAESEFV